MKKHIVEFIGTFFLVFTIGMTTVAPGAVPDGFAPIAIASALMVMVYAGGHISGAHYNPAVTLAVFLRGKCSVFDVPFYWFAQVAGALAAAFATLYLKGKAFEFSAGTAAPGDEMPRLLIAEFLFTFALAYVVLNVATAKGTSGNSFYGLAIGFTVLTGAFAVGGISGGAFNPAVAVGAAFLGNAKICFVNLWIFMLADFAGAAVAGILFNVLNTEEAA